MAKESIPKTRDHTVPRMYLKRFAKYRGYDPQICAAPVENLDASFVTGTMRVASENGFYWGTDDDGVPHHHLEEFLSTVEDDAIPAFRRLLDSGKRPNDDALPPWPPKPDVRLAIAWWLAAQILRTVRQRQRLEVKTDDVVEIPKSFDSANRHIRYIAEMVEPIAASLFFRPWGIGFTNTCLLTGDVPAIVFNAQDHDDQQAAISYWDVYIPLDPHRCLYFPGQPSRNQNSRLRRDHRFVLQHGMATGLNAAVVEASVRHVFFHPDHDPRELVRGHVVRNPEGSLPNFLLWYDTLESGLGIERRWLDTHPEPRESDTASEQDSDDDALAILEAMHGQLEAADRDFQRLVDQRESRAD